jgi:hypothetical protein
MVKEKCLCSPDQKTKSRSRVQRRRNYDTYAMRVEGRSKEGFISFTKLTVKKKELVLPRLVP